MCSPDSLEALVIGELVTEGIICSMDDLSEIIIDEDLHLAKVLLKNKDKENLTDGHKENLTDDNKDIADDYHMTIKAKEELIDKDIILAIFQSFVSASDLFKSTGGVHSCAIVKGNEVLYHQDDISRQNAINKVIGLCYQHNLFIGDELLLTSCRISSEIMKKVIHSGIRIIISKSAPTDVAIELAKKNGMILYGFARGQTMNRYS